MIYLDHNATTPLCAAAREAMLPWLGRPTNPMAMHRAGRDAMRAVDEARAQVGALTGVPREQVFFTSGATEGNSTVLANGRWAVSAVEHPSVLAWAECIIDVDEQGRVLMDAVDAGRIDGVSVMLANNETGVVQPLDEVRHFCARHGLLLHVDASQGPGRLPVVIDADFLTLSAHKFGGPQGVGAIVSRGTFQPLLRGGPQERGRRAGTHNVAGIVGFGAAAAAVGRETAVLRDRLEAGIGGRVAGAGAERLPNTCCVAFDGVDAQDLVIALDLEGIAVSVGSACASGSPEPSHVLRAMGFVGSAVRFSLGEGTTEAEIDAVIPRVRALVEQLRG